MADSLIQRWRRFQSLATELVEGRIDSLSGWREGDFLRRLGWFGATVWKGFAANRCLARAAALAYATVLALVPLLAIALSVSTFVLKEDRPQRIAGFIDRLVATVAPQLSLTQGSNTSDRAKLVQAIQDGINRVESGALGIAAFAAFAVIAISLLSTVEGTFNDIWSVRRSRNWFVRTVFYWAFLTLGPLFLFTVVGITGAGELAKLEKSIEGLALFRGHAPFLISLLAFCGICSLLYFVLPNTRVDWRAALLGGAVAGTVLQLNNHFSAVYVSRVLTTHQIYGSLSIIPLFLFGLYLSWSIILLGAQVAACFQNRDELSYREMYWRGSRDRETAALRLMTRIGARFRAGEEPPSVFELAKEIDQPRQLVRDLLSTLAQAQLIRPTNDPALFLPARPLEAITVHDVFVALRDPHGSKRGGGDSPFNRHLVERLDAIAAEERRAAESLSLLSLVEQLETKPGGKFEG